MAIAPSKSPHQHVFIVEDDHAVRDALVMMIEAEGWLCHAYATGEQFLKTACPTHEDILILDLDLPGIKGPEIAAQLRAKGSSPSIYVISGLRNRAFEAGVNQIQPVAAFRKPLDTADLLDKVGANYPRTL